MQMPQQQQQQQQQMSTGMLELKHTCETELVLHQLMSKSMVGRVIGKGGGTITEIRSASGASIKIEDAGGLDERIATISVPVTAGVSAPEVATTASVMMFDKMCEPPENPDHAHQPPSGVRFLVHEGSVGAIIGKGGSIINQLRQDTGANVRVNKPSAPAAMDYKILDLGGTRDQISQVLKTIATILMESPPRPMRPGPRPHYMTPNATPPMQHSASLYQQHAAAPATSAEPPPSAGGEMLFYLACPVDQVGTLVAAVAQISTETQARINVSEPSADSPMERVVTIAAEEQAGAPYSGVQDAIHKLVQKMHEAVESTASQSCKLLAPRTLAGGVIGKGGSIINSIRRESGATVNVSDASAAPSELVPAQSIVISGPMHAVHHALRLVGAHLRKSENSRALSLNQEQANPQAPIPTVG
eukprot:TRINITY_DN17769_c0_g1_i7.p1 TRINITY_DN17769_c0_g1~~TRINITY_DN17769_c0_g1_i7.p1  ORF type:complete len:417 (+),score=88.05 TRINITY_DN17769_c0_g1_i7:476-1726(+)